MKTHKVIFAAFAAMVLGAFVLTGCSDEKIVTENTQLYRVANTDFKEHNILSIERVENNEEKSEIIMKLEDYNIRMENYDLDNIEKFLFIDSEIIMYSISDKYSVEKIILYRYKEIYQATIAKFYGIDNDFSQFELLTLDNEKVFSLQVNKDNRIGNFIVDRNEEFEHFNHLVLNSQGVDIGSDDDPNQGDDEECCRKQAGWSECMDCTVSACGDSWVCVAVLALRPVEMLAAFAVSCIGAGSNATC